MARNIVPIDNQSPTLEACEVHSMSMEMFARKWAKEFFADDTEKYLYGHLAAAITFIPYGAMVDHFQHIMYENPELTPEERHKVWSELESVYRPWISLGDLPFYKDGRGWQRQMHIYQVPFYYIDYCLAQTVALEFWALMQTNYEEAWEKYISFVKKGGTETFSELISSAGMGSPFEGSTLREVSDAARGYLDEVDV